MRKIIFLYSIIFFYFLLFLPIRCFSDSPKIISSLLNDRAENITFNPRSGEEIDIFIKADRPVKFSRLYICAMSQVCNGTSGNYTRYFSQSSFSESILKTWNGKISGDTDFAPLGVYRIMVSMIEEGQEPVTEFGEYTITISDSVEQTEISQESSSGEHIEPTGVYQLLNNTDNKEIKASIINEKIGYVNLNTEFFAKSDRDNDIRYEWSFGDGYGFVGKKVFHKYKIPGDYVIVLNAFRGENKSTYRSKIIIIEPNLSLLSKEEGVISVVNKGNHEINIGNLRLRKGYEVFSFAQDTIILPGKEIKIIEPFRNKTNEKISLLNQSDDILVDLKILPTVEVKEKDFNINELELDKFVSEFKRLSDLDKRNSYDGVQNIDDNTIVPYSKTQQALKTPISEEVIMTDTETKEKISFWEKIFSFPSNIFRKVKKTFYE